jgi:hypothetical protein
VRDWIFVLFPFGVVSDRQKSHHLKGWEK